MTRASRAAGPVLGAALAALAACSGVEPRVGYVAPSLTHASGVPVVVIARGGEGVGPEELALASAALDRELEATGRFAPILLSRDESARLAAQSARWVSAPPAETLVALSRRHGADAVAVALVRTFDPYPPAQLSLAVSIHATESLTLLFSGSVCVDGGESGVARELRSYRSDSSEAVREPSGLPVTLSRERLARFACRALLAPVR